MLEPSNPPIFLKRKINFPWLNRYIFQPFGIFFMALVFAFSVFFESVFPTPVIFLVALAGIVLFVRRIQSEPIDTPAVRAMKVAQEGGEPPLSSVENLNLYGILNIEREIKNIDAFIAKLPESFKLRDSTDSFGTPAQAPQIQTRTSSTDTIQHLNSEIYKIVDRVHLKLQEHGILQDLSSIPPEMREYITAISDIKTACLDQRTITERVIPQHARALRNAVTSILTIAKKKLQHGKPSGWREKLPWVSKGLLFLLVLGSFFFVFSTILSMFSLQTVGILAELNAFTLITGFIKTLGYTIATESLPILTMGLFAVSIALCALLIRELSERKVDNIYELNEIKNKSTWQEKAKTAATQLLKVSFYIGIIVAIAVIGPSAFAFQPLIIGGIEFTGEMFGVFAIAIGVLQLLGGSPVNISYFWTNKKLEDQNLIEKSIRNIEYYLNLFLGVTIFDAQALSKQDQTPKNRFFVAVKYVGRELLVLGLIVTPALIYIQFIAAATTVPLLANPIFLVVFVFAAMIEIVRLANILPLVYAQSRVKSTIQADVSDALDLVVKTVPQPRQTSSVKKITGPPAASGRVSEDFWKTVTHQIPALPNLAAVPPPVSLPQNGLAVNTTAGAVPAEGVKLERSSSHDSFVSAEASPTAQAVLLAEHNEHPDEPLREESLDAKSSDQYKSAHTTPTATDESTQDSERAPSSVPVTHHKEIAPGIAERIRQLGVLSTLAPPHFPMHLDGLDAAATDAASTTTTAPPASVASPSGSPRREADALESESAPTVRVKLDDDFSSSRGRRKRRKKKGAHSQNRPTVDIPRTVGAPSKDASNNTSTRPRFRVSGTGPYPQPAAVSLVPPAASPVPTKPAVVLRKRVVEEAEEKITLFTNKVSLVFPDFPSFTLRYDLSTQGYHFSWSREDYFGAWLFGDKDNKELRKNVTEEVAKIFKASDIKNPEGWSIFMNSFQLSEVVTQLDLKIEATCPPPPPPSGRAKTSLGALKVQNYTPNCVDVPSECLIK